MTFDHPCLASCKTQHFRTFATFWTSGIVRIGNIFIHFEATDQHLMASDVCCFLPVPTPDPEQPVCIITIHLPVPRHIQTDRRLRFQWWSVTKNPRRDHWSSKNQTTSDIFGWPNLPVDGFVQYSCKVWTQKGSHHKVIIYNRDIYQLNLAFIRKYRKAELPPLPEKAKCGIEGFEHCCWDSIWHTEYQEVKLIWTMLSISKWIHI